MEVPGQHQHLVPEGICFAGAEFADGIHEGIPVLEGEVVNGGEAGAEGVLQKRPSYEAAPAQGVSGRCGPSSSLLPFQLLRMFFRQQDEIRRLKDELSQKDIRIRQLQLELKNLRNSPKNN